MLITVGYLIVHWLVANEYLKAVCSFENILAATEADQGVDARVVQSQRVVWIANAFAYSLLLAWLVLAEFHATGEQRLGLPFHLT